jgi:hypothetical protein
MRENGSHDQAGELGLVKLYEDITGSTESQARNVFMYVCSKNGRTADPNIVGAESVLAPQRAWEWAPRENRFPSVRRLPPVEGNALSLRIPSRSFT